MSVGTKNEETRKSWIEKTLKRIPAGGRILDAGAGEQKFRKFCSHLEYVSQDFAQYDGRGDQRGLQTGSWNQTGLHIVSDIAAIPEPDGTFDAVMCIEVFEHLPEPILAIKEFSRLLKPGGTLIITAPFCSLTHFAPFHFYTGFNRYFYKKHLAEHGFVIDELVENGNFFEFLAQELRRTPEVASTYTKGSTTRLERLATRIVLKMLGRLSASDSGSRELLHFGCFVRATRR